MRRLIRAKVSVMVCWAEKVKKLDDILKTFALDYLFLTFHSVSYPDGPITARYRFIKNAGWDTTHMKCQARLLRKVKKKKMSIWIKLTFRRVKMLNLNT